MHYYQKECVLFGNMYSGRHENIKIPGGQYMSAETETQYNPQYGIRRTIFSDEYLPGKGDLTDTITAYDYPKYLLMDVGEAYDRVCADGQFDQYANGYLVIWSAGKTGCAKVVGAAGETGAAGERKSRLRPTSST